MNNMNPSKGFTLIELMIVVGIIGILAAIAIPTSYEYRQKAFEDAVLSDLRNAASIEEGYFAEHQAYKAFAPVTGNGNATVYTIAPGFDLHISENVTLTGTLDASGTLTITGAHPGSVRAISYNTTVGMNP